MEVHFNNPYLEKLYAGLPISGKPKYNDELIEKFRSKIIILQNAENTLALRQIKSLHFEALKEDKKGIFSIRIDRKYRLEFLIDKDKITLREIIFIEDLSNHYR